VWVHHDTENTVRVTMNTKDNRRIAVQKYLFCSIKMIVEFVSYWKFLRHDWQQKVFLHSCLYRLRELVFKREKWCYDHISDDMKHMCKVCSSRHRDNKTAVKSTLWLLSQLFEGQLSFYIEELFPLWKQLCSMQSLLSILLATG